MFWLILILQSQRNNMALNTTPNIITKPIVSSTGQITLAQQVVLNDSRNTQTVIIGNEGAIITYNLSASVDGTDPGTGNLSLNNAAKASATTITFSTISGNSALNLSEIISNLQSNDRILLQEKATTSKAVIYRVTGAPVSSSDKIDIQIISEQSIGDEFTVDSALNVSLFFTRIGSGPGSLPQQQVEWLAQTASRQRQSTTVTNIADSVTDVLLWRRENIVTNAIINNPGTGLRIDEANRQSDGSFDRPSGTAVYDDDLGNTYIYIAITSSDFGNLTLSATFLEARRGESLVFSSSLQDLTTPTQVSSGQFTYRRTTNLQYRYIAGDTLTIVTRATATTTEYIYNAPIGDFTPNIRELSYSAIDDDFSARIDGSSDNAILVASDRVKLTGLLVSSSIAANQNVSVLYKEGDPSGDVSAYDKTWNTANPLFSNFGSERVVSILVDNNITITSITGGATLGPQLLWIPGKYIYKVTLPAEVSTGMPTSHLPVATVETFLPSGFNSAYKVVRENIETNLLAVIDDHQNLADISALETKVNNLFPLTPDVGILNDWADIYDPIHGAATVDILDGYSLIADYRSDTDRYESAGVVYATGTNVITYTGLSNDLHRSFGFKVTAPANKVLMWIVDGATNIPFIDITAAGNIRVNNFTPAQTVNNRVENQASFLTRTGGTSIVTTAPGSVATFTIPNFPTASTERSRTLQIAPDILVGGTDTLAGRPVTVDVPSTNTAQAVNTISDSVYLGPRYGSRTVTITIGYEFRVSGANLLVDLTLVSAPSDVSVDFEPDTAIILNYTAQSVVARIDNFLAVSDGSGNYTFTGEQEFILSMRPQINSAGGQTGLIDAVPAAVGADGNVSQLNDVSIRIPTPVWSDIQVADDIEFRTFEADHYFRHAEIAGMLRHRNEKWAYGIARLQTDNPGHSITEPVNLAAGSTISGNPIGPGTVQAELIVYQATNKTTGTDGLISSIALPANYGTYKYIHITEYDVSSLQFRHTEMPTQIFVAGLVEVNDNVRLQGNTVMSWTAATRTLAMNPAAQEIVRVTLKD